MSLERPSSLRAKARSSREPARHHHADRPGRRRWILGALAALILVPAALYLLRAPILRGLAHAWIVDETARLGPPPASANPDGPAADSPGAAVAPFDAIVMLSGSLESRTHASARLYLGGYAPRIVLTDIPARQGLRTPGEDYISGTLMADGVPPEAIVIRRTGVASTFDEAEAIRNWAWEADAKRIIVVTDPFHTRRTRWIVARILAGTGIDFVIAAARPLDYEVDAWWTSEFGLIDFNNEVIKYLFYRWKY